MYRTLLLLSVFAIGCVSYNNKEFSKETMIGAGVGTVGGAVVGRAIGGGPVGLVAGGIIGGAGGGVLGHMIHKNQNKSKGRQDNAL